MGKPFVSRILRLALLTPTLSRGLGRKLMLESWTLPANREEQRAPPQRIDGDLSYSSPNAGCRISTAQPPV
jgi:hypothetical protein